MTRRAWFASIVVLGVAALVSAGSELALTRSAQRADCPGQIVCPLTGELVCKDRCPLDSTAQASTPVKAKACCPNCAK
jgi:hypothetical protein